MGVLLLGHVASVLVHSQHLRLALVHPLQAEHIKTCVSQHLLCLCDHPHVRAVGLTAAKSDLASTISRSPNWVRSREVQLSGKP